MRVDAKESSRTRTGSCLEQGLGCLQAKGVSAPPCSMQWRLLRRVTPSCLDYLAQLPRWHLMYQGGGDRSLMKRKRVATKQARYGKESRSCKPLSVITISRCAVMRHLNSEQCSPTGYSPKRSCDGAICFAMAALQPEHRSCSASSLDTVVQDCCIF